MIQNELKNVTWYLSVTRLIFLQASEFSVNKQDHRTMKTELKHFWPFRHFRVEEQKLSPFLVTKYMKNYVNYKNWPPFLCTSMKKK